MKVDAEKKYVNTNHGEPTYAAAATEIMYKGHSL